MSGICAILHDHPEHLAETLGDMTRRLALDTAERLSERVDCSTGAGVGLAIRFATQQIYQSPRILMACDAELLNEQELRQGAPQQEDVDPGAEKAALLSRLYERFGDRFVEKLQGAFSIVLWDREKRRMLAAIDGFGINRLVYHRQASVLVVASRLDALTGTGIDLKINPRCIANYLNFSSNLAPETVFTNTHRLTPGSLLIAEQGSMRIEKFWDMRYGMETDSNEDRLSWKLESVLEQAVTAQCKDTSFSELGAFLSGGTDSSTVVGMMSRMQQGRVKAFSIGFQEQSFDELGYARLAAERFQANHHTYLVGANDCLEALPRIVGCFDEPFGNSSAIPTYFCSKLAAENGVKVLLAGDGGDELFGGNERYLTDKIFAVYQNAPYLLRKGLVEPLLRLLPFNSGLVGKARRYVNRSNLPPVGRFCSGQFLCANDPQSIFQPDFLAELGGYSVLDIPTGYYEHGPATDHLDRLLYVDIKITLADNDLPKVTCASELAGIQTRFPFLDRTVAEFSGCIPARLKVKGRQKRYLFKRALRELLPVEIIKKKKHGFGIPVATWMKSDPRMRELTRDTLLSKRAFGRGYFQPKCVEELFRMHEATDDSPYYGDILWTFLMLELWHNRVVDDPVGTTG
jgi:asparagine synthase (glutamine-hydrolysing)